MQTSLVSRVRTVTVALATAAVLGWAGPRPGDLPPADGLSAWFASTPLDQSVALLAGAVAEVCLLYLLTCAALVLLGRLPGLTGRLAGAVVARVAPAVVRRSLESALGLTVATASLATGAMPALAAGPVAPRTEVAGVFVTTAIGPSPVPSPSPPALPSPTASPSSLTSPSAPTPPPSLPSLDRPATASGPTPPPLAAPHRSLPPPRPVASAPADTRAPAPTEVVVHRGDSLWRIAARHLEPGATDAQVAAAWPRWYAANRAVIGPDPDLLLPGQRLRPPS